MYEGYVSRSTWVFLVYRDNPIPVVECVIESVVEWLSEWLSGSMVE